MRAVLFFAGGHLLLLPLGAWLAFHPSLRRESLGVRVSAALAAGAVGLTAEAMALTALGIRWTPVLLCAPLVVLSTGLAWRWSGPGAASDGPQAHPTPRGAAFALASAASLLALAHLGASLVTERATSVDYVYFWGVKAARFAAARSIDPVLLGWEYFFHAVPSYPPLVPVVEALPAMLAGGMAWKTGPLAALVWFLGSLPVVWATLRRRLPGDGAAAVAGFWTSALALSLVWSFSGGNGEAPILFFLTVAGAALLCERPSAPGEASRALAAVALAGAALTKVEGLVGALFLVAGVALRDRLAGRPRAFTRGVALAAAPVAGVLLWFGFQRAVGLPVGYAGHGFFFDLHFENVGKILTAALENLSAGTVGLSWIFPAAMLLLARSRRDALPALALVAGTFAFLFFDYLHDAGDPSLRIGWTLPRVSQPALSLWILAAGMVGFEQRR